MVGWDNTVTLKRLHLCKRTMKWMFVWCEWKTEEVGWEINKMLQAHGYVIGEYPSCHSVGIYPSFWARIAYESSDLRAQAKPIILPACYKFFFRFACKLVCCVYRERVHDGCGRGMKASVEVVVCVCREKLDIETGTDCCVFGLSVHDEHVRRCFVDNLFFYGAYYVSLSLFRKMLWARAAISRL